MANTLLGLIDQENRQQADLPNKHGEGQGVEGPLDSGLFGSNSMATLTLLAMRVKMADLTMKLRTSGLITVQPATIAGHCPL